MLGSLPFYFPRTLCGRLSRQIGTVKMGSGYQELRETFVIIICLEQSFKTPGIMFASFKMLHKDELLSGRIFLDEM